MPITVLLSDEKEVIRLLLNSDPEIRVVGEPTTFRQSVQSANELKPQVVVVDLDMPDASSVSPQEIKSLFNRLGSRVIAISFRNDRSTQALAESFGAAILLDKLALATELIAVIKAATLMRRSAGA